MVVTQTGACKCNAWNPNLVINTQNGVVNFKKLPIFWKLVKISKQGLPSLMGILGA